MAIIKDEKKVTSRLIKKPIIIPDKVEVKIEGDNITVNGPKGTLEKKLNEKVLVIIEGNELNVKPNLTSLKRVSQAKDYRAMAGTFYAHIRNMVKGVTQGFEKDLRIVGVGYRAALKGKTLNMALGYSHEINVEPSATISFEVPAQNRILVKGINKEEVGQVAANIRKWREPLAYGGKGIRYVDEVVRIKVGKKV